MYTDFCEIIPGLLLGSVNDVDDMVRAGADVLVPLAFMHGSIWNTGFRGEIIYCPITDMSVLPDDVLYLLVEMISRRLGSCGLYWQTKKRILKERFGIEWQSPGDIYKGVIFD